MCIRDRFSILLKVFVLVASNICVVPETLFLKRRSVLDASLCFAYEDLTSVPRNWFDQNAVFRQPDILESLIV